MVDKTKKTFKVNFRNNKSVTMTTTVIIIMLYLSWCLHLCTAASQWRGAALGGSSVCSGKTLFVHRCCTGPHPPGFSPRRSERRWLWLRWSCGCTWSWVCPRSRSRPPRTPCRWRHWKSILGKTARGRMRGQGLDQNGMSALPLSSLMELDVRRFFSVSVME